MIAIPEAGKAPFGLGYCFVQQIQCSDGGVLFECLREVDPAMPGRIVWD